MISLDFEQLIVIVSDYISYTNEFFRIWKKEYGGGWWISGTNRRLDAADNAMTRAEKAFDAVRMVTGIDYKVMIDMARVDNEYMRRTGYQKCLHKWDYERLFQVLTASKPKTGGPYLNEYTDAAIARIERARW